MDVTWINTLIRWVKQRDLISHDPSTNRRELHRTALGMFTDFHVEKLNNQVAKGGCNISDNSDKEKNVTPPKGLSVLSTSV